MIQFLVWRILCRSGTESFFVEVHFLGNALDLMGCFFVLLDLFSTLRNRPRGYISRRIHERQNSEI